MPASGGYIPNPDFTLNKHKTHLKIMINPSLICFLIELKETLPRYLKHKLKVLFSINFKIKENFFKTSKRKF